MSISNSKEKDKKRRARKRQTGMLTCIALSVLISSFIVYGNAIFLVFGLGVVGTKGNEIRRERVTLDEIRVKLGSTANFRRAYRMKPATFYKLHRELKPELNRIFFPDGGGLRDPEVSKYLIDTEMRLSIGIRYYAGGSPYDIKLVHGVGRTSIFVSVWGVCDAVNNTPYLDIKFPNHDEQRVIASGFEEMSGCDFPNVVGAIDGLLIWICKPSVKWCQELECNEGRFKCARKDKFGMNLQAICDNKLRFTYLDIHWPGSTSDYLSWITTSLCHSLENPEENVLFDGATIIGDSAYVKKKYMAVPLRGVRYDHEDAYNFYLSQLRITIERAFGSLVHRWAILRAPLVISVAKVSSLVLCLCKLHNFLIDENENTNEVGAIPTGDAQHLLKMVKWNNHYSRSNESVVRIEDSRPVDLLDCGNHAEDYRNRRADTETCPMDRMLQHIEEKDYYRPLNY